MPVNIFICYAREDKRLLNKLKAHLRPLQHQGLINVWYDRDISAGTEWEQEIKEHLNAAQIVLLLVSPAFMDSDYCYSIEMKRALERHDRHEAKVIPIILRPVYWQGGALGKLQALPRGGKPIISKAWHDIDSALYDVTEGIYQVVKEGRDTDPYNPIGLEEGIQTLVEQARQDANRVSLPFLICQHCGAINRNQLTYCRVCGIVLQQPSTVTDEEQEEVTADVQKEGTVSLPIDRIGRH